jgi:hypothetical protein
MNDRRQKNKIIELSRLLIQALEINNIANILGYHQQLKMAFIEYEQKEIYRKKKTMAININYMNQE